MKEKIVTAEYVSKGHPDKVCDQISDAILDECLKQDNHSRVAVETMGGHGKIFIAGEISTHADIDAEKIAEKVYKEVGYRDKLTVDSNLVKQSPDIAAGVDTGGAGDQGIMVGYACSDNEAMLPQELYLAREIIRQIPEGFGPDAKAQVTLDGDGNGEVDTIVISAQHPKNCDFKPLYDLANKYTPQKIHINPCGIFEIGGFAGDTGLTGRKIAVDNYGPQIPVGGGAFSGKDATKVDRSAAYMARRIAVDFVKAGKCKEALVKIAYSIGIAEPVMAIAILDNIKMIDILKTGDYDLRPKAIIDYLGLDQPIFYQTARNGHFGNAFPWDN